MIPAATAQPRYDHLLVLGTSLGIYEHARGSRPDPRHGYCLDDVGRVLTVLAREPQPQERLLALGRTCLAYTERAVRPDGLAHPVENVLAIFTLVVGLVSFVLGLIVRNTHAGSAVIIVATATGLVSCLVGLYVQMISSTREQRVLIVTGIIAGFVGLAIGFSKGGFVP